MTYIDKLDCEFKLVLLPFPGTGGQWYGYMVHDRIPDLDETLWAKGDTAGQCATALDRKVREYVKANFP